jgi:hypothetical protein
MGRHACARGLARLEPLLRQRGGTTDVFNAAGHAIYDNARSEAFASIRDFVAATRPTV